MTNMEPMTEYMIIFKNKEFILIPLPDSEVDIIIKYMTIGESSSDDFIKLGHHRAIINIAEILCIIPHTEEFVKR